MIFFIFFYCDNQYDPKALKEVVSALFCKWIIRRLEYFSPEGKVHKCVFFSLTDALGKNIL